MQFLMPNLWKGCSFPVNIVKEQKDWEALVEHSLPSARAVTQTHEVFTPSAHLQHSAWGWCVPAQTSYSHAGRDALTTAGLQSVLPWLCRCCCRCCLCEQQSHLWWVQPYLCRMLPVRQDCRVGNGSWQMAGSCDRGSWLRGDGFGGKVKWDARW